MAESDPIPEAQPRKNKTTLAVVFLFGVGGSDEVSAHHAGGRQDVVVSNIFRTFHLAVVPVLD